MNEQRKRATRAYEAILNIRNDEKNVKKLKTLCMKTPSLIQQSGATQSVVFLRAREGEIGQQYTAYLAQILDYKDDVALHKAALKDTNVIAYMMFSEQLADAAAWLRRFAQSELADIEEARDDN